MGAHSSPVYLEVPGRPTFDAADAAVIATIIDGARTWVESIAPVAPNVDRRRLIAYFEAARAQLDALARERASVRPPRAYRADRPIDARTIR